MEIEIEKVVVGELNTNCYILKLHNEALVIDPGDDVERIIGAIGKSRTVGIVITHRHFDHVGALEALKEMTSCGVYDFQNLKEGENTISNFTFEVIFTPGHTEDSICLLFKEYGSMFVGDFIFKNAIGRWDLAGGNFRELKNSIKKILDYDLDIKVYPGHGETTSLRDEKDNLEKYLNYQ